MKLPKKIITIRDVAKAAGVSISTVSKAMNGNPGMGEETRKRVLKAAKAVGFRRNDLAHALHRGTSKTVGIVSSDNFGRFTMPIAAGLEMELSPHQISVFLCNATDDVELEKRHIAQLLAKRVDGLVFTARRLDKRHTPSADELGIPIVFAFSQGDNAEVPTLLPDDEQGARLAVEHLVSLGHRRIAHITGPQHFEAVQRRSAGYRTAITKGRVGDYSQTLMGRWSEASGYDMARDLFAAGRDRPDAIFAGSDQIARGAMEYLREHGISIPQDVSIIGFDNWEVMAEAVRPKLTTIDMNLNALGAAAGNTLMRLMKGEIVKGIERLPCSLIVRESTRSRTQ